MVNVLLEKPIGTTKHCLDTAVPLQATLAAAVETPIHERPEDWADEFGDLLFRTAVVRLGDRVEALDLVQETFLAALRGIEQGRFDGAGEFRSWLRTILRNKVIDHIRKRKREQLFDTTDTDGMGESLLFKLTGVPDRCPDDWAFDVESEFERKEFWAVFENCLAELPEVHRSVFTLRVLEGVSTEQVCEILGLTSNYVGVALYRARKALQRSLESKWFVES